MIKLSNVKKGVAGLALVGSLFLGSCGESANPTNLLLMEQLVSHFLSYNQNYNDK